MENRCEGFLLLLILILLVYTMIRFRVRTKKENKAHRTDVLWLMQFVGPNAKITLPTSNKHYYAYNPKFSFRPLAAPVDWTFVDVSGAITVHTSKARVGVSEGGPAGSGLSLLRRRTHVVRAIDCTVWAQ